MAKKKKSPEQMQAAYRLQKLAGREILPAEEAVRVFSYIAGRLAGAGGAIEKGICETMAIKAESLQDAIRELRGEIAVLSAGLSVPGQDADALLQRAQKAAAGFARDAVLHEICTFEEILIHSVPRIEGTDAALCLTQAHTELIMILKKNGIEAIRPEPHQAWNAREHEVLIAEEAEGFQRGEIIKCMGTGFRTGADILVRANVLVAK